MTSSEFRTKFTSEQLHAAINKWQNPSGISFGIWMSDCIFAIPIEVIADNRAIYYADVDNYAPDVNTRSLPSWRETYETEFEVTVNNQDEAYDWVCNSMEWSEIEENAVRVPLDAKPNYEDQFCDAMKEFVKLEDLI